LKSNDEAQFAKPEHQRKLEERAVKIIKFLADAGYKAYFTGGWVRDYILNSPSSDIDIVTDAPESKILELDSKASQNFGVYVVNIEGEKFEIAHFRKDGTYLDGRKPTNISLAKTREDAERRDLTINGLYFNPLNRQIIDYVHGVDDICN